MIAPTDLARRVPAYDGDSESVLFDPTPYRTVAVLKISIDPVEEVEAVEDPTLVAYPLRSLVVDFALADPVAFFGWVTDFAWDAFEARTGVDRIDAADENVFDRPPFVWEVIT